MPYFERAILQTLLQNHSRQFGNMRRASIVAAAIVLLVSLNASADQYRVSGVATYSDSTTVIYEEVSIQCEDDEYDCHEFRGITTRTNGYGYYELEIDIDDSYDGAELLLMLLGESTRHIINMSEMDEPPVGRAVENLELDQDRPQSPVFSGVGCGIIILSLAFAIILVRTARRLSTPRGRAEFVGYRAPNIVDCPDCDYKVEQHLLIRHLIVDHGYDAFDAGEVAGRVFIGTWKPENEKDGAEDRI